MSSSDQRPEQQPHASMRVKLKYVDEKSFIEKFGAHVTRNGIFLATRSVKPPGTVVRFELQFADGRRIMKGEGVVAWKRDPDPQMPQRPPGMGLRYTKLDADSRKLVERIAEHKAARGQKDEGGVPQAPLQTFESGPVSMPSSGFESGPVSIVTDPGASAAGAGAGATAATAGLASGSSPGLASAARAPARVLPDLAAMVPEGAEDDTDVRALIDEDDGALDHVLERARRIAKDARGQDSAGSDEDQLLRALEGLLTPGPIDAALESIETASQALATMLGAAAPERRRYGRGGTGAAARSEATPVIVATRAEPRPVVDSTPLPLGPTPATPAIARPIRRTQPPPPPPRRSSPTQPPSTSTRPSVLSMPALATATPDEVTREVSLAALAEADASLATGVQQPPDEVHDHDHDHGHGHGDFGSDAGVEATRVSPPALLRDILADDVSTGIELEAAPLPAPPRLAPGTSALDANEPHTRTAEALAAFALEASELDALAPGAGRARRNTVIPDDDVDVDIDEPDASAGRGSAGAGDDDDDAEPVDDGALLEIDPDEDGDESETTGVSGISGITPQPASAGAPFDDLSAALDAALDIKLDGDDNHDGHLHDPDEVPTAASRAPLPPDGRLPGSTTSPPSDGGEPTLGEDGQPRKKGFFSKIFKK